MRKKLLLAVAIVATLTFNTFVAKGQGMAINRTGAAAATSSMLDISDTAKGVLVPRMTNAQRDAISSPATSLLIYQTDATPGFYYYDGGAWTLMGSGGGGAGTIYMASFTTPASTVLPFYVGFLVGGSNITATTLVEIPIIKAMTIDALGMWTNVTSGAGSADAVTVTLYKNGATTGMSTTLSSATTLNTPTNTASFGGGPVSVAIGDKLAYSITHTNGTPVVQVKVFAHGQ